MAKVVLRESAGAEGDGEGGFYEGMLDHELNGQGVAPVTPPNKKRTRKRRARGEPYKPVPPEEHRFKPGQSGNPQGRPRKRKQLVPTGLVTMIAAELMKTQKVRQGDKLVSMTGLEMIVKRLMQDAVAGDSLARTRAVKTFALLGAIDVSAEMQELELRMEEATSAPFWTPEMEAAMAVIDAEFLTAEPDEAGPS